MLDIIMLGLIDLPWWGYVLIVLVTTHITIASVTIYLHRCQAHRALTLGPIPAHFMRFWLWLTTGMVTREWVAIHRKHHAKCETNEDPHSPQQLGLAAVLLRGTELYQAESRKRETIEKYGHGIEPDWIEKNLYGRYSLSGLGVLVIAEVLLFGPIGLVMWAIQMLWIPIWAAGVINGVGHFWGYRNYETTDASRNISPWGILVGGEELHNNHHAFASSAKLSSKPWEFDIGWMYIRLMEMLGQAKVKKVAPRPVIVADQHHCVDMEMLQAVFRNRLHVMADYGRRVMTPVFIDEVRHADYSCQRLFKQVRSMLAREKTLLDESAKSKLEAALEKSKTLKTVYQFRSRLQVVWGRSSLSQEKLLAALQDWCRQADESGIKVLQDFSRHLRQYRLQPV